MRRNIGFTLVEMLVVIAIIGILAALITPAIYRAIWSARQARIKTEVDQLHAAFEAIRAKYGSYPPAQMLMKVDVPKSPFVVTVATPAMTAFVDRAFPHYAISNGNDLAGQIVNDLAANGFDISPGDGNLGATFNPQTALVFWLSGFSTDVTDPFNRNLSAVTRTPFFNFDQTRVLNSSDLTVATLTPSSGIGTLIYNAPYGNAAYAYFDYQSYGSLTGSTSYTSNAGSLGPMYVTPSTAALPISLNTILSPHRIPGLLSNGTGYLVPYLFDMNANGLIDPSEGFANPQSFQIIAAGQDGAFGTLVASAGANYRLFPSGVGYDLLATDDDNVTNLAPKSSLDASKP
jgi:prepilin-type N-terminal cleavage/methylation domain-containing protein